MPFTAFSEYEDASPKGKKVIRWFAPKSRGIFFFAGVYNSWYGDYGTKQAPNEGWHALFSFLTTDANDVVRPIHAKAMPVVLTSTDECEEWLEAPTEAISEIQSRVLPTDALEILPHEEADQYGGAYLK